PLPSWARKYAPTRRLYDYSGELVMRRPLQKKLCYLMALLMVVNPCLISCQNSPRQVVVVTSRPGEDLDRAAEEPRVPNVPARPEPTEHSGHTDKVATSHDEPSHTGHGSSAARVPVSYDQAQKQLEEHFARLQQLQRRVNRAQIDVQAKA